MPYPRRLTIYLHERHIPTSLILPISVSDPQAGDTVLPPYSTNPNIPPRPKGSLPLLLLPSSTPGGEPTLIRQSLAIINFIEDVCNEKDGKDGWPKPTYDIYGGPSLLGKAREAELLALADQLTETWNPVRTFGTKATTFPHPIPEAAKEMLKWVYRPLYTIESWWNEENRTFEHLKDGGGGPSVGEIVLYQFLEFVRDCYGVNLIGGSGDEKDVYGRERGGRTLGKIGEFFELFGKRESVRRDPEKSEVASEMVLSAMKNFADGVL
ncbi:hypothetical protein B0J14DRAFT_668802 [Halenospora varia]|nr:hypothetical protein B0J14DRAFT_668802 [Halenospora varia]